LTTSDKRGSGVLLHFTSLPSEYGIGDLGDTAHKFADMLAEANQRFWQVLPVLPPGPGDSPYSSWSVFGANQLLISPEKLIEERLIAGPVVTSPDSSAVDFPLASAFKEELIGRAYLSFKESARDLRKEFDDFCAGNSLWLEDHAFFESLRREQGKPWYLWPDELRDRDERTMSEKRARLGQQIEKECFGQFIFHKQWRSLREHLATNRTKIIGDIPFYPALDSADVWAHPELFKLDSKKSPIFVAGVPPDYFSATGQLWGNPVYDWDVMAATGFEWWMQRLRHELSLFDIVRLDHFRGFVDYWEVPAGEKTADNGRWVKAPTQEFFGELRNQFPSLPFIAEDLGIMTPEVVEATETLGLPGMKVLLFAFDSPEGNVHIPYNHVRNSVVYTGTHDTNTVRGWFSQESSLEQRERLFRYLGRELKEEEVSRELIRLAQSSTANLSIVPMQDLLSLGSEARMNMPSNPVGNWKWKLVDGQLTTAAFQYLRDLTETFGRS
jgi:4-alpha-glucanotransferase